MILKKGWIILVIALTSLFRCALLENERILLLFEHEAKKSTYGDRT